MKITIRKFFKFIKFFLKDNGNIKSDKIIKQPKKLFKNPPFKKLTSFENLSGIK